MVIANKTTMNLETMSKKTVAIEPVATINKAEAQGEKMFIKDMIGMD